MSSLKLSYPVRLRAALGGSSLVWASDWANAEIGSTVAAVRDGTKWDSAENITGGSPFHTDRVAVMAATGLGFPAAMAKVLAIRFPETVSRFTGNATASTATSLTDAGNNFTGVPVDLTAAIRMDSGPCAGQHRLINGLVGTTQLNISAAWTGGPPNAGDAYYVYSADALFCGVSVEGKWSVPAIGSYIFRRRHIKYAIGGTNPGGAGSNDHHPDQTCTGASAECGQGWLKVSKPTSAGENTCKIAIEHNGTGGATLHTWGMLNAIRGEVYRVEERYQRLAADSYAGAFRIYDSANVLRAENPNCGFGTHNGLPVHSAATVTLSFTDAAMVEWTFRNQGVGLLGGTNLRGSDDVNNQRMYWGGAAIRLSSDPNAWIGEYLAGEAA